MKNKLTKKIDPVLVIGYIVVILIHLFGYLVSRTTPDMSPLEVDRTAVIKVVSGVLGIISIIAMYIVTVKRTRNQNQLKCPSCGSVSQSPSDKICHACGTSLVN